jgi:hypothetical protein
MRAGNAESASDRINSLMKPMITGPILPGSSQKDPHRYRRDVRFVELRLIVELISFSPHRCAD